MSPRPGGFYARLALAFSLTLIPAVALTGVLLTRTAKEHLVHELTLGLFTELRLIGSQAEGTAFHGKGGLAQRDALRLGNATGHRITLIDAEGAVFGDSGLPGEALARVENHKERPEVRTALEGGEGSASRHSGTLGADFLYAALPVRRDGRIVGVVRAAVSLAEVHRKEGGLRRATAWITACVALLALVSALVLSRSLAGPVREMSAVADKLSRGELGARVRDLPPDEHGRLGATLNLLAEKVQSTITELSQEKARLTLILSTMVEAVVAVDSQKTVFTVNEAFSRLCGVAPEEARGKPFCEVTRDNALSSLLERVLEEGESRTREIRLYGREELVFEAAAIPIREGGKTAGVLLVLHDITRLRRLEELRRDFVANVSHELRTPLASIQGSAETLLGGALEKQGPRLEFTQAIKEDADRLSLLVEDLLDLSAIESGKREPRREPVSVLEIARKAAEKLRTAAAAKRVGIEVLAQAAPQVRADKEQLLRVFTNLLDNALKFNKEGGSVVVSAAAGSGLLTVSVKDTGLGIPAEDLPRLFERFYRVDKARSRELGGTGLGLSIVKHIVEAHGGTVSVESVEGQGSDFRFTLPL